MSADRHTSLVALDRPLSSSSMGQSMARRDRANASTHRAWMTLRRETAKRACQVRNRSVDREGLRGSFAGLISLSRCLVPSQSY